MDALLNDINGLVITKCKCTHDTHSISAAEVVSAVENLNLVKRMVALRLCQTIL